MMGFLQELTQAKTLATGSASSDAGLTTVRAYYGANVRETGGAAAVVRIRDGDVNGKIIDSFAFTANQPSPATQHWTDNGVEIDSGKLFVERVSGSSEVTLYWG